MSSWLSKQITQILDQGHIVETGIVRGFLTNKTLEDKIVKKGVKEIIEVGNVIEIDVKTF